MEDFMPFELAVKLKEKGFSCEYPFAMYNEDGEFYPLYSSDKYYYEISDFDSRDFIAPTISQVLKWLREKKKIYIMVDRSYSVRGWHYYIIDDDDFENPIQQEVEHNRCYEQAAIDAIEYALDNLI